MKHVKGNDWGGSHKDHYLLLYSNTYKELEGENMRPIKKGIRWLLGLAIMLIIAFPVQDITAQEIDLLIEEGYVRDKQIYSQYRQVEGNLYEGQAIDVDLKGIENQYPSITPANETIDTEGQKNVVEFPEGGSVHTLTLQVPKTGYYEVAIEYLAEELNSNRVYFSLFLDGQLPFLEAQSIELKKAWQDLGGIERDKYDNDITPKQRPANLWQSVLLQDYEGKVVDPYQFYLEEGTHEVTLYNRGGTFTLRSMTLQAVEEIESYQEYADQEQLPLYEGPHIKIQGEQATLKSDFLMYPYYDRTTPSTEPSHYAKTRINVIGGSAWSNPGTWIEWEFEVPETALYEITVKYRQNISKGMAVGRKILIDGEIPFDELKNYKFDYSDKWALDTLAGEKPYLFRLEKGKHTLRMEVTLGELAETLGVLEACVLQLNNLYTDIVMYTGSNPDPFRDYELEREIPDLMTRLNEIYNLLDEEYKRLQTVSQSLGNDITEITQMLMQLSLFIKDSDEIITSLGAFNGKISALGMTVKNLKSKPLEVDYIEVHPQDAKLKKPTASFFEQMAYDVKAFFASFTQQYNTIGEGEEGAIEVWASTGRDQASILRTLIDEEFTAQTGIPVNLSIVDTGNTLIQATLAGKGPDVALMIPKETPINLAMRGGLEELSKFQDYDEVKERFYPSAFIPYEYNGGMYAVPETQSYNMMFYRKDIFEELGLQVPNTWEEFYDVTLKIQKNKLQVGILEDQWGFETFVFQRGQTFYTEDKSRTTFNTQKSLDGFRQWTELYTEYGLDRTFDFYNRFRTGEMPLAIQPYTMFNQITVAAPELAGLWDMVPIPGTIQEDGTLNRAEGSIGKATVMIKGTEKPEDAFEFIKWWSSADVIAKYANELEMIMGPAARYDTANIEAFNKLPWEERQKERLMSQWEHVTDIPQIPGNYYIQRNVSNAFRRVVDKAENPREVLSLYNEEINAEIQRKRIEFGLE